MKQVEKLSEAYIGLARDKRITVYHISIYMAFLYLWTKDHGANSIIISRKKIMKLAHVNSIATYHKCITQLQEFGYINYLPSYNPFSGSQITIWFDSGEFPK